MNGQNKHTAGFIKGGLEAVKSGLIPGERFLKRIGVENLTDAQFKELLPFLELNPSDLIMMEKRKGKPKK